VSLQQSLLEKLPDKYRNNIGKPIMLQHGLSGAADSWFMNGINKSIGFYLVNKGYDVWVGSNRGTKDCKSHINKNITKSEFYDYSFQEMGWFDLPEFYKLILAHYNSNKTEIIYIGHSQGTSQFFVAAMDESTKNLIKSSTKKLIAISPIVF